MYPDSATRSHWIKIRPGSLPIHYPSRHTDGFNRLRYDGSAKFRKYTSLDTDGTTSKDFLANVQP
jgi:hypothetical protein